MIIGIGTDVCDISRVKKSLEKHGEKFLSQFLTPHEIEYCKSKKDLESSAAARFAAKEALIKAVGEPLSFKEIEIQNDENRKPKFVLGGKMKDKIFKSGESDIHLSISHDANVAIAFVVIESKK